MNRVSVAMVGLWSIGSITVVSADPSELVGIKLGTLWRIKQAGRFEITASIPPPACGSGCDALYYAPASPTDLSGRPIPDLGPLYRLKRGADAHDDDIGIVTQTSDGYSAGGNLGYVWTKADGHPGVAPVIRAAADGGTGAAAHTLMLPGETINGFSASGTLGYAYPRELRAETLVSVSQGDVTVKSNASTGGAVWEWWWKNRQFVNDYDYGRQVSMAVYTDDGKALEEGGDEFGGPDIPLYARHPSPTLHLRNSDAQRQSSRAVPVEWLPDHFSGGPNNPVIYPMVVLGKELTLNWHGPDHVDRKWPVALYESIYEGPALPVATVEAPTAYLTAEFTTYYKYDPKSDSLTPITINHDKVNVSGGTASGVIIASGGGPDAVAMGVYVNDPNAGLVIYDNAGPSGGKFGSSFSKWGVVYRSGLIPKWTFRSWIATDNVRNIQSYFHQLYLWHVTSRGDSPSTH